MRFVVQLTLIALAAAAVPGCSDSRPGAAPSPSGPVPVVVALGDSLTEGTGLPAADAYPSILQGRMQAAGYRHRVVNAGVTGDTSADAAARLAAALEPDTRVLILAIGANDGLQGVPIPEVRANLSSIIERAQQRGIRVLLCGMETPPTRGWDYTVAFHRLFPELAARYQLPLMPFLLDGVVGDPAYNLPDRIHPNAAGQRRIAENMWEYLEPLLRATS